MDKTRGIGDDDGVTHVISENTSPNAKRLCGRGMRNHYYGRKVETTVAQTEVTTVQKEEKRVYVAKGKIKLYWYHKETPQIQTGIMLWRMTEAQAKSQGKTS